MSDWQPISTEHVMAGGGGDPRPVHIRDTAGARVAAIRKRQAATDARRDRLRLAELEAQVARLTAPAEPPPAAPLPAGLRATAGTRRLTPAAPGAASFTVSQWRRRGWT
jgi:hypothetical protein